MRSAVMTIHLVIVQENNDAIVRHESIINKLNEGDFKVSDYSPSDKITITLDYTKKERK